MSKEAVAYQPRFSESILPEWSFGLLGNLIEQKNRVARVLSPEVTSIHKNWDNTSYCRSFSVDAVRQYSADEFLQVLAPNFTTFTDEYCLGTPIKTYEYTPLFDKDGEIVGTNGVENAYRENAQAQAVRFQERLKRAGNTKQRGEIETYNSQRLDRCVIQALESDDVAVGTKIVWFSPPGFKIEGYHGVSDENHSFIWVYEKKSDEDGPFVEMTQFRCWPNLRQTEKIHNQLSALSKKNTILPQFPEGVKLTKRNSLIAQMIELPQNVSLSKIEKTIYASEDKWKVKRKDMPNEQLDDIDRSWFEEERDRVLELFLRPIYQKILGYEGWQTLLKLPYSDPFWKSDEYKHLIVQLDIAFAISKQALDKWVESQMKIGEGVPINIMALNSLYTLQVKHVQEGLTTQEAAQFNSLAPMMLSLGNRLLSVGQCGLGTVIPLNIISKLQMAGLSSSATQMSALGSPEVRKLSSKEKDQFRADVLGRYSRLEVKGRNGVTHIFWVLNKYYKDYVGNCYEDEEGVVRGPCDVPMTMDQDSFILTDEKYQELLEASLAGPSKEEQLEKLDREEEKQLFQAKDEKERDTIRQHFKARREKLKGTVSITELWNNDIYRYRRAA